MSEQLYRTVRTASGRVDMVEAERRYPDVTPIPGAGTYVRDVYGPRCVLVLTAPGRNPEVVATCANRSMPEGPNNPALPSPAPGDVIQAYVPRWGILDNRGPWTWEDFATLRDASDITLASRDVADGCMPGRPHMFRFGTAVRIYRPGLGRGVVSQTPQSALCGS